LLLFIITYSPTGLAKSFLEAIQALAL